MLDTITASLAKLHPVEKSAISISKLSPDYICHVDSQSSSTCLQHGSSAKLAITSSDYCIRLYTRSNLATNGTIKGHKEVLTGIKFAHTSPDLLYSSSEDGTIRCWDMRTSMAEAVLIYEGYTDINNVFTAFDLSSDDRMLCAGTEGNKEEDTYLIFWDARKADQLGVYTESHVKDITQVCFHPTDPDRLISGSVDGLVNLYDLTQDTEEDALMTSLNTESSVAQIGWCGPETKHVFCTTHINTFHMWETLTDQFDTITNINNRDKFKDADGDYLYLVDCFQPDHSDTPVLVCGNKSGQLHLKSVANDNLEPVATLDGGHSDVVRCLNWDAQDGTLVTGGEDAMLCLWSAQQLSSMSPSDGRKSKAVSKFKKSKKRISTAAF